MARVSQEKKPITRKQSSTAGWEKLTWQDLSDWAGERSVSRGSSYQRDGRVRKLLMSKDGTLLAWVQGVNEYAVRVELDASKRRRSDRIISECSCPVQYDCKHAVATILEYLDLAAKGKSIPIATERDLRLIAMEGGSSPKDDDWEDDDWEDDGDDDFPEVPKCGQRRKKIKDRDIRDYLASKSSDDLVDMVMRIYQRDPDVRRALVDECALANGRFDKLCAEARSEIRLLTAEEAWVNSWTGDGHVPDYSGLMKRLKTLLDHGYADPVVELGVELFRRGSEQVERSNDEGETCCEIGKCMMVVFEALLKSDRSDEEKIMFMIDMALADDYGICEDFDPLEGKRWKKATWSIVADRLGERLRLQSPPTEDRNDWSRNYQRRHLGDWAVFALDGAGRTEEATELCVREARESNSYERAVQRLMDENNIKRAEQVAMEGLQSTPPRYAGIVSILQDLLCKIAIMKHDWMLPASVAADRFFRHPNVSDYHTLLQLAKKAGHERTVQAQALAFLENGQRPDTREKGKSKRKGDSSWPLSEPPIPKWMREQRSTYTDHDGPYFDVLIDLAIEEKSPDDVLRWFDRKKAAYKRDSIPWFGRASCQEVKVAEAVQSAYPERAIEIYQHLAESIAAETNTRTYPEVGEYLSRIRRILKKSGRESEWDEIISTFRDGHKRKWRLMEVLDGIEGRPIAKRSRK